MDKKSQTKIVLERTIAGEEFSALKSKRHNSEVFSNFTTMPKGPRAEDVFKSSATPQPAEKPGPVVVTKRSRRIFTKPSLPKPNEP
jgi:hypothetical protein